MSLRLSHVLFLFLSFTTVSSFAGDQTEKSDKDKDKQAQGGVIGDGGSVIRDENGNLVPADAYFKSHQYHLPPGLSPPVDVRALKNGAVFEELQKITEIVKSRTQGKITLDSIDDFYEFHFTEKLSGEDPIEVEAGKTPVQVAYTYDFTELMPDFSFSHPRIIELKKSLIDQLSPADVALIIRHEMLHHAGIGGHEIISPLMSGMRFVLAAFEHQERDKSKGAFTDISEDEYQASIQVEYILRNVFLKGILLDGTMTHHHWEVNRKGGGVLYYMGPKGMFQDNFIGISSLVYLDGINYGGAATDGEVDDKHFRDNVIVNSSGLKIATQFGESTPKSCNGNHFENTDLNVECFGTENRLDNVHGFTVTLLGNGNTFKDSFLSVNPEFGSNNTVNKSTIWTFGGAIDFTNGHLSDSPAREIAIQRIGDSNLFEHSEMSIFTEETNSARAVKWSQSTFRNVKIANLDSNILTLHLENINIPLSNSILILHGTKELELSGLNINTFRRQYYERNAIYLLNVSDSATHLSFDPSKTFNLGERHTFFSETWLGNESIKIKSVDQFNKDYGKWIAK